MDTSDTPPGRWIETEPADRAAFAREHPETVVGDELLAQLEPVIARRATKLSAWRGYDRDLQAELRNEIVLRVIEAATATRSRDADGAPVYDYLAQRPEYIVWHAAGKVYSRQRREMAMTNRRAPLADDATAGEGEPLIPEMADAALPDPSDRLEHAELYRAINERLTGAQRRVLAMLDAGYDRPEIGVRLRISRKTVHKHVQAIRAATVAVCDGSTVRDLSARSSYRHSPHVAAMLRAA